MAREIDADALQELCNRRIQDTWNSGTAPVSWAEAYADFKDDIDSIPTLTPPNEWVSVEERLPQLRENVLVCAYWHEHWGVYIGWNSGHGWTVSCGIGQRSDVQVSHWMNLPAPPDRRPPEGKA